MDPLAQVLVFVCLALVGIIVGLLMRERSRYHSLPAKQQQREDAELLQHWDDSK